MSETTYTARVNSWQARGETLYGAVILMNGKTIHRVNDRATEQQVRADATDWARQMGKRLQWDGAPVEEGHAQQLTLLEERDLSLAETRIQEGLDAAEDARKALTDISERKLYRAIYKTFEEYCEKRWGVSARQGWRFVAWSKVERDLLSGTGEVPVVLPATESQARPLAPLPPEERREVWGQAVASVPQGKVTAKVVEAAVRKHKGEDLAVGQEERADKPSRVVEVEMSRVKDGDIDQAYSADLMSFNSKEPYKIRKPFEFEGKLWCKTGGTSGGIPYTSEADAYPLVPVQEYDGPKPRQFSYQGTRVKWAGQVWCLGRLVRFKGVNELRLQGETLPSAEQLKRESILDACQRAVVAIRALQDLLPGSKWKFALNAAVRDVELIEREEKAGPDGPEQKPAKGVKTAGDRGQFVLCRMPSKGAIGVSKKPRFIGIGGGWTPHVNHVTPFRSRAAAVARAHSYDEVLSLDTAKVRVRDHAATEMDNASARGNTKARLAAAAKARWRKATGQRRRPKL